MNDKILFLQAPQGESIYYLLDPQKVTKALEAEEEFSIRLPGSSRDESKPLVAVILGLEGKDYAIDKNYVEALLLAGADLTFIHYDDVDTQLEALSPDAFLLPGGCFDSPSDFYQKPELLPNTHQISPRSLTYIYAIDYANERQVPMLGICAGFQMLAGMSGAKMYVSLKDEVCNVLPHKEPKDKIAHSVALQPNSLLHQISGAQELNVNSVHSEGVINDTAELEGLHIVGVSADNVVEAVEGNGSHFVVGVQWHPEYLYQKDKTAAALFAALLKAAKAYQEKKNANR